MTRASVTSDTHNHTQRKKNTHKHTHTRIDDILLAYLISPKS